MREYAEFLDKKSQLDVMSGFDPVRNKKDYSKPHPLRTNRPLS